MLRKLTEQIFYIIIKNERIMPSTIPYDPSLILGNVVHPLRLANIEKISQLQAPADAAEA